ncbi:hypothetical protein SAMN04488109_4775 [Chryseolinea serpens]|uniref:DUF3828 domain-containing protein n=1 Tax=Chryseolinea serpens TaxID=947013 RepID=A0A1M5UMG4_9BACT|nr:hypothetical protein [Chryseolinea serpens]SHH64086.1 hypothetical protein SAMN04488109_4775 [Chryseolinea serpens]
MPKFFFFFIALFLFVTAAIGQKKEVDAVKASFDNYKAAILNDQGEQAVKHIDGRTIKYYDNILEEVKMFDSAKVESLSLLDKMMVFSIRHRASKAEILSFDGSKLFVYAIQKGMVGKNSVVNSMIGEVTISGTFAKGQLVVNDKKVPIYFHFYKEQGQWKVDLTSIFPVASVAFKKAVDNSGQSEDDFLFSLLEMLTGKKPGPEIWVPTKG